MINPGLCEFNTWAPHWATALVILLNYINCHIILLIDYFAWYGSTVCREKSGKHQIHLFKHLMFLLLKMATETELQNLWAPVSGTCRDAGDTLAWGKAQKKSQK
jgi:hypothetical protein